MRYVSFSPQRFSTARFPEQSNFPPHHRTNHRIVLFVEAQVQCSQIEFFFHSS